jgi:hypothetical protein
MKVRCIKNDGTSNRDFNLFLTVGKIYEAKKNISGVAYTIEDDSGGERNFPLSYFIEIKEEEKKPKFDKGSIILSNYDHNSNQCGIIEDVKMRDDGTFIYRIGNNWFSEEHLVKDITIRIVNNEKDTLGKEKELKVLQNYLISELNKVSDQLERIQSDKR